MSMSVSAYVRVHIKNIINKLKIIIIIIIIIIIMIIIIINKKIIIKINNEKTIKSMKKKEMKCKGIFHPGKLYDLNQRKSKKNN